MKLSENCQKATVYTMDNTLICEAWVAAPEDGWATLIFPGEARERLFMQVRVIFDDPEQGRIPCQCTLSDYRPIGNGNICQARCFFAMREDRKNARQSLRVLVTFRHPVIPCDAYGRLLPKVYVTVKDFGGGGMFFESDRPFAVGETFYFIFNRGEEPFLISAEILRVRPAGKTTPAGYGCRFLSTSTQADSALYHYVFSLDLLQKNKRL